MEDWKKEFDEEWKSPKGFISYQDYECTWRDTDAIKEFISQQIDQAKQEERERVKGIIEKMASDWDGSGSAKVQLALNDVLSELKEEK